MLLFYKLGPITCRYAIADAVALYSMQCSKWFDPIATFKSVFIELSQLPMLVELYNSLAQCLKDDKYSVYII